MSDTIPIKNYEYKNLSYWNKRYSNENLKDWLCSYEAIENLINKCVKKNDSILILGCGNSLLSEEMTKKGFHNVTNIDYSKVVVNKMSNHCSTCNKLDWLAMDAKHLFFRDQFFDVIIEKATLDAIMSVEKDPWTVSAEISQCMDSILHKVSRILVRGGKFISITFAPPHFRGPLYAKSEFDWSMDVEEFGSAFHYFFYVMTKGERGKSKPYFKYTPPKVTFCDSKSDDDQAVSENEDYLLSIEVS